MDFTEISIFNERINEILDLLSIDYSQTSNGSFVLKCPIHDSDSKKLYIYTSGIWQCFTRQCHEKWGKNIVGFTRGVLSNRHNINLDFNGTFKWLCKKLDIDYKITKVEPNTKSKNKFVYNVNSFIKDESQTEYTKIPRSIIEKRLEIPSKYFIQRGYSESILKKYSIGDCTSPSKEFFNRAVVPIFNHSEYAIGFLGRSIFEECPNCKHHHSPQYSCPIYPQKVHSKWINSNFTKTHYLFNYWNAEPKINELYSAIVVESVGDVLKLEQAGIQNSLAILGSFLSPQQKILLEKLNIFHLILLLNNDEAGQKGQQQIIQECGKLYKISCPRLKKNDLGEMSNTEIIELMKDVQ